MHGWKSGCGNYDGAGQETLPASKGVRVAGAKGAREAAKNSYVISEMATAEPETGYHEFQRAMNLEFR